MAHTVLPQPEHAAGDNFYKSSHPDRTAIGVWSRVGLHLLWREEPQGMRPLMGQVPSWKQGWCSVQAAAALQQVQRPGSQGQGLRVQVRRTCERARWLEQPVALPSVGLACPCS